MSLTLFYANGACSLAPHIALEETGAAFTPHPVDTPGGEQHRPEYLAINPRARVPALQINDGTPWVLTECGAILTYVAHRFPAAGLWPAAAEDQARALEWMAWIASSMHISYAHIRRAERYATTEPGLVDVRAQGFVTTRAAWESVEQRLQLGAWAVGDAYSVVDPYLLVFFLWGRGAVLRYDMARDFPAWTEHARRMAGRPAVQRALAREGIAPL